MIDVISLISDVGKASKINDILNEAKYDNEDYSFHLHYAATEEIEFSGAIEKSTFYKQTPVPKLSEDLSKIRTQSEWDAFNERYNQQEIQRAQNIISLYGCIVNNITSLKFLMLEQGITPEPGAIRQLWSLNGFGVVCALYPTKEYPQISYVRENFSDEIGMFTEVVPACLFDVAYAGSGFSLWATAVAKNTFPFQMKGIEDPYYTITRVPMWELWAAKRFIELYGLRWKVDGLSICKHE